MGKIIFFATMFIVAVVFANGQGTFPSKKMFENPDVAYLPQALYFWNNTLVDSTEIKKQMLGFKEKCAYGGFGILPFGDKFQPEYLSDEYFKVYGAALKQAKKLGLTMCLYDEYGFPSGGMGANNADGIGRFEQKFPGQTIKRLDKIEYDIYGTEISMKIPEGQLMAAVAMESSSLKRINLRKHINGGELQWTAPEGDWKLMFFMCVKDGDPIVDYLDPVAVSNFVKLTHQEYYERFSEYFGSVITGTFFDEPTMYRAKGRMWTGKFNEKFNEKYRFDPEIYYPALWYDIGSETAAARDYLFGFRSELYAKGFMKAVNYWSADHGLYATGHQDQEEILNPVSVSGDFMKCFKYQDIPGIDKIGGNRPAERFYKIVSSSAYNWDKTLVMSETYGAMGNISWGEIFSVAMDQYAKGINMLIPHAVWYDDENVTFKPELSFRNPLYADSLKVFNQFLARLNLILQREGRHVADIAMLYPIQNLQAGHCLDGPLGYYKGGVEIPNTDYVDLANLLTEVAGKDFTFIHPEVLDERCDISGGKLILNNKVNMEQFDLLIVPSCKVISVSNLEKIAKFHKKGGKVIFTTQLPARSSEFGKDSEIEQLMGSFVFEGAQTKSVKAKGKAVFIEQPNGQAILEALGSFDILYDVDYPTIQNLRYIHKVVEGKDVYYFANIGDTQVDAHVKLRGKHVLEKWDPHNGAVFSADVSLNGGKKGESTTLHLNLKPFDSVFYIEK